MSEEVIRYGAGGIPYKSFKTEEAKPEVTPEPEPVVQAEPEPVVQEEVVVEVIEGPEVEALEVEVSAEEEVPVTIGSS